MVMNNKRLSRTCKALLFVCSLTLLLFVAQNANATSILEIEPNNSLAGAQNIDADFSTGANADIINSVTNPWVSISGTGDGTFDYYSFTVANAGDTGIFDIDYGISSIGSMDTVIELYSISGGAPIAWNDDASTSDGAGGSTSFLDSYLSHTFASAGTYVISVLEFPNVAPSAEKAYTLQVSIENHATSAVPEPSMLLLLGSGLVGLGYVRRRFKK